jgi:hypothetical protein
MLYKLEEWVAYCMYLLVRLYHVCLIQYHHYFPHKHLHSMRVETLTDKIQIHTYRMHTGHTEILRKLVFYDGVGPSLTMKTIFQDKPSPPWWYIGADLQDGSKLDMTEEMHDYIVSRNHITLELLNILVPSSEEVVQFTFIHPETFEEIPINSEGIVVDHEPTTAE